MTGTPDEKSSFPDNAFFRQYARLIPFLLFIIGIYMMPVSILHKDLSRIPGDLGDARFNNYILEHGYQYLIGNVSNYWDAPFLYPLQDVIALSDNHLGSLPIYVIFRFSGFNIETSFQLWFIVICGLNYVFSYLALFAWFRNKILAATGGFIFAFSIFTLSQLGHAQVFPRFMVPLIFLWFYNYLTERKIKYAWYAGIGFVIQLYCGMYLGVFTAITLVIFNLSYLATYPGLQLMQVRKKLISKLPLLPVIGVCTILIYPLIHHYLNPPIQLGYHDFSETYKFLPTIQSYFFAHNASTTWSWLVEHGRSSFDYHWNHQIFTGIIPWLGIFLSPFLIFSKRVKSEDKKLLLFLLISTAILFFTFLRIGDFTVYKYLFNIPGIGSIRDLTRVINVEVFLFLLIFACTFNILSHKNVFWKLLILLMPVLVIVDNHFKPDWTITFSKQEAIERTTKLEKAFSMAPVKDYDVIAYTPIVIDKNLFYIYHLDAMIVCQKLNLICINGYTGYHPQNYQNFLRNMDYSSLMQWTTQSGIPSEKVLTVNEFGTSTISQKNVYLLSGNKKYLCAEGHDRFIANRSYAQLWEEFTLYQLPNGKWLIKSYDDYFLSVDTLDKKKVTSTNTISEKHNQFNIKISPDSIMQIININNQYLEVAATDSLLQTTSDSLSPLTKFKFSPVIR